MGSQLSEFALIRRFFTRPAQRARLGIGDDAALIEPPCGGLALSVDTLNEGVHFLPGTDARRLGHKSLAVNLSDLAAMGAAPRHALLALSLPSVDERWLEEFSSGLFALAGRYGVELIGGDTTRGPLSISITVLGEVPLELALRRDGARAGDDIWVSGELGGAALGLACLQARARLDEESRNALVQRLEAPQPRIELGLGLRGLASAAIDISDGLTGDLGHLLERSGVAARIEYARVPRPAAFSRLADAELERELVLAGGDDYELLFTAPAARRSAVETLGAGLGLPLARIGAVAAGAGLVVCDAAGAPMAQSRSHDHFAAPRP